MKKFMIELKASKNEAFAAKRNYVDQTEFKSYRSFRVMYHKAIGKKLVFPPVLNANSTIDIS